MTGKMSHSGQLVADRNSQQADAGNAMLDKQDDGIHGVRESWRGAKDEPSVSYSASLPPLTLRSDAPWP